MDNKTTADLREELFRTIEGVRDGSITPAAAKSIGGLAENIIATADLEMRFSELVNKLDKDDQGISPGPLLLTGRRAES